MNTIDVTGKYATPLTPEQHRVANLEYRLAQQEYQIKHVDYLVKRLKAAADALSAQEERSALQADYIDELHLSIARLGARGEAAFTKDQCLTLSLKITEEMIAHARPGLRQILAYLFADMQEQIERKIGEGRSV